MSATTVESQLVEASPVGDDEVRQCRGTRKTDGLPCKATGQRVDDDGWCFSHRPGVHDQLVALGRKGGLASAETRREQAKSVRDRLREKVEAEADEVWRVYRDAWDADTEDGIPDHRARLTSVEGVLAQVYGRPATTIVGDDDRPLAFRVQQDGAPTSFAAVLGVMFQAGALPEPELPGLPAPTEPGSASDNGAGS